MFLLLFGLIVAGVIARIYYQRSKLPPGPFPVPLAGNLLELKKESRWEDAFIRWQNQYGGVYTWYLSVKPVVNICSFELIQKYIVKQPDLFSDRLHTFEKIANILRGGLYGIIMTSGDLWRSQRRFALKVLRDFGLGKMQMEGRVMDEVETVLEKLDRDAKAGILEHDFYKHTDVAIGSVINSVLFGFRFTSGKETEFDKYKTNTTKLIKLIDTIPVRLALNWPILLKIPVIGNAGRETVALFKEIFAYLQVNIDQHLAEHDYSEEFEPKDFVDAYLLEMHRQNLEGKDHYFTMKQLQNVCFDMWLAGQETSSNSLLWIMAYMIVYPEVQEKVFQEIRAHAGSDRLVYIADRADLPYTNAVINECLRCVNPLSNNIPRELRQDTVVEGHLLKAGTMFIPQISTVLHDEKIFPNPTAFNPSRFLDEEGKLKHIEEFIPFSIGRRSCPGEGLARMELFLFVANLLNQYKFMAASESPRLKKLTGSIGLIARYKCKLLKRQ